MADADLERQRHSVAAACHDLAREGLLIGTAGNVSVRSGDHIAVSPTRVVLRHPTPDPVTALEGRSAALMANHGAIAHGPTLDKAVENALLLEWACGVYLRAATIGTPRALSTDQQAAVITAALNRGYGRTRRIDKENAR